MTNRHVVAVLALLVAVTSRADETETRVERTDGSVARGTLLAIDTETVTLTTTDGKQAVPLAEVRRILLDQTTRALAAPTVQVVLVEGGELSGTDLIQEGGTIVLTTTEGKLAVPAERVRRIAWGAPAGTEPAWVAGLPPKPGSDLLVVRREGEPEFVECAIASIGGDTISVVLDGETIPVKRTKVSGIEWLRETTTPAGGTVVIVRGGRLQAKSVRWSPEGHVLDDSLRMPAAALRSIDYAAGRSVPLATVEPERVDVEPYFGGLRKISGLASFFAPRTIVPPSGDGHAVLLVRPQTVLTYRVPADSRRFRAHVERDVPATATTHVDVLVMLDDKEVFRRRIDAATAGQPVAIDADTTGGRRLTLTVNFVPGDLGCGLRISGAAFEK